MEAELPPKVQQSEVCKLIDISMSFYLSIFIYQYVYFYVLLRLSLDNPDAAFELVEAEPPPKVEQSEVCRGLT